MLKRFFAWLFPKPEFDASVTLFEIRPKIFGDESRFVWGESAEAVAKRLGVPVGYLVPVVEGPVPNAEIEAWARENSTAKVDG